MGFSNAAEVTKYIGGIFDDAFADPEIGPRLAEVGSVVAFDFSDPDAFVLVDLASKSVQDHLADGQTPAATLSMTADTGNAYWQGKVNLPLAMAKKKIQVEGNVASLLKLAPLSKKLTAHYIERLKNDGRDDLIV
ncbi:MULTISPECIES: SCP2 sterol-binding domain-containing protein [unclassified Mycobacterium]|uniref:SCP2 sterol-binding domain-containing protein n=1 Tax=unclassified Mycobacterium TaxID=2642494 RepID=UPI00073FE89C|nr:MULTISPECIES: SCP2 sterol-binding domain-containing protein [unclassified Mycobacterium]KUH83112.1 sterol carrier protein [Mycobacterium sp. GA-0227b]KUH84477.1 sterol carrier protein [Mycobacterium sp. GA-1999]KUH89387.1 sterol carrier protein [Mycobacterium sp. IS-1556]